MNQWKLISTAGSTDPGCTHELSSNLECHGNRVNEHMDFARANCRAFTVYSPSLVTVLATLYGVSNGSFVAVMRMSIDAVAVSVVDHSLRCITCFDLERSRSGHQHRSGGFPR